MSNGQIEAAAPVQAVGDIGLAQLLESQRLERCPFPIPSSWFFVDFSENLAVGQVRNIQLFDQEWVLFRGESGKVPHVRSLLRYTWAHTWAMAEPFAATSLRCPFHHWEYNAEGFYANVPYGKVAPAVIKKRPILRITSHAGALRP